jgi:hypothetical protein
MGLRLVQTEWKRVAETRESRCQSIGETVLPHDRDLTRSLPELRSARHES